MDDIFNTLNGIIPPKYLAPLTALFVISQVLGRMLQAIRAGGGLRSIILGVWFGTNTKTDKQAAVQDDPTNNKLGLLLLVLLCGFLSFGLVGCGTTAQRPPSPTEQKYFEIQTNYVPVVVLVTNTPAPVTNGALVTLSAPMVQAVTNQQEQYTFVPNNNAKLVATTGGAVGNVWGVGGAVGGGLLGLFTLWGLFRSRKSAVASAEELAQIIETGRQILRAMPEGAKYEAAWKDWMVKHQSETQTIAQVSQLVALAVDNDKAKGAAQTIVNLIAAQPK